MPEPKQREFRADPQVFAGQFLAALEIAGHPAGRSSASAEDARLTALKRDWHVFRQFVEWAFAGEDVKEYEALMAKEAAMEAKKAAVEKADRDALEARREKQRAAMGAE